MSKTIIQHSMGMLVIASNPLLNILQEIHVEAILHVSLLPKTLSREDVS